MGCGQKAWDEREEERQYDEDIKKIGSISDRVLLKKLEEIRSLVNSLNKETNNGSRRQYQLLDNLMNIINWREWS